MPQGAGWALQLQATDGDAIMYDGMIVLRQCIKGWQWYGDYNPLKLGSEEVRELPPRRLAGFYYAAGRLRYGMRPLKIIRLRDRQCHNFTPIIFT